MKAGSGAGVHLELLQADEKRWRDWNECLRVNPAHLVNPFLEKTLRREFDEALNSERAAIPFRQYRLKFAWRRIHRRARVDQRFGVGADHCKGCSRARRLAYSRLRSWEFAEFFSSVCRLAEWPS